MPLNHSNPTTKGIKRALLVALLCSTLLRLSAQTYSASIRQYIDYYQDTIALVHCYLADVVHKRVLPDQTVVMEHGIITATGDSKKTRVPAGATIIDCTGKSVLPGFVMLHEHMFYPAASESPFYVHFKQLPVTFPRLYLACGVTTIRTTGSIEPYSDLSLKQEADAGSIIGPEMYVTAPYMEGPGGFAPQMRAIQSAAEAKEFVNFWADEGFTSFKAYMNLDGEVLKAAIEAVHARGLKITGHLCAVTYREAALMGIDQLEHGFLAATDFIKGKKPGACSYSDNPLASIDPRSREVMDLIHVLVSHKVMMTSTLAVFEGLCRQDSVPGPSVLDAMAPDTRDMYVKYYSHEKSAGMDSALKKDLIMEKEFSDAGGLLTVGTDPTGNGSVLAGYGSLRAIELLTREGFSPIEAIRIATYNGATALNALDSIGSVEAGKNADLVVVEGNIQEDINRIANIKWVFRHGVGFDSQKILKQLNGQVGKY